MNDKIWQPWQALPASVLVRRLGLLFILVTVLLMLIIPVAFANGSGGLDPTFGGDGVVTTSITTGPDAGFAVAVQSDEKIVVAGTGVALLTPQVALVRYNTDGSPDTTFDGDGVVTTSVETGVPAAASGVAVQGDGKIVAAGASGNFFASQIAVLRYNSDGQLDSTFGLSGVVTTTVNTVSGALDVALQPDGKVVAVGLSGPALGATNVTLARYGITGTLDGGFGAGGVVTTTVGGSSRADGVALQNDGKIVIAGRSDGVMLVARYTISGSLDNSFGTGGFTTTAVGPDSFAFDVAVQPDGKIVTIGQGGDVATYTFALVRYNSNGTLDSTFGNSGVVTTPIGSNSIGSEVLIQPDGKILAIGSSGTFTQAFALARYNSDGALDTTFGSSGTLTTTVGSLISPLPLAPQGPAGALAGSKIVVAGSTGQDFITARYVTTGGSNVYLPVVMKN